MKDQNIQTALRLGSLRDKIKIQSLPSYERTIAEYRIPKFFNSVYMAMKKPNAQNDLYSYYLEHYKTATYVLVMNKNTMERNYFMMSIK